MIFTVWMKEGLVGLRDGLKRYSGRAKMKTAPKYGAVIERDATIKRDAILEREESDLK